MDDTGILRSISTLVAREHLLRAAREAGALSGAVERGELAAAETELDRCWDLLRQRRARREHGADPDRAEVRPVSVVEQYWQ